VRHATNTVQRGDFDRTGVPKLARYITERDSSARTRDHSLRVVDAAGRP
jgi:hypothetical protein